MDILSFGLGIGSVVLITSVVIAVLSFVKLSKLNKHIKEVETNLYSSVENIYNDINRNIELDNRRIDGEINRTDTLIDTVYRTMDSRFDRLETKLMDTIKNGCEPVKKKINK
jgi:hypothetical protein